MSQAGVVEIKPISNGGGLFDTFEVGPEFAQDFARGVSDSARETNSAFRIPSDDISYEVRKGTSRLDPKWATKSSTNDAMKPIPEVINYFNSDSYLVNRKYEKYSSYPKPSESLKDLPSLDYDIDYEYDSIMNVTKSSQLLKTAFVDPGSVEKLADETGFDKVTLDPNHRFDWNIMGRDIRMTQELSKDRVKLFDTMNFARENETASFESRKGRRIKVSFTAIEWVDKLDIQLSWSVTLFDAASKRRVSETISFKKIDPAHEFIFEITSPHSEIFFLITAEKRFEGDVGEWADRLAKGKISADSTSKYTQPLGWTALFPFDENYLGNSFKDMSREVWSEQLFRYEDGKWSEEDLIMGAIGMKAAALSKKKSLSLKIKIKLDETSSVSTMKRNNNFVEEITTSAQMNEITQQHHCHIWPQSLNITKAGSNFKNVTIRVQLRSNDNPSDEKAVLKAIYVDGVLSEEKFSVINYHSKTPNFLDEFKVGLPLPLSNTHHILFTFYHISYTNQREDSVIGYSIGTLFDNDVLVSDGEFKLPLLTELPDKYLSMHTAGQLKSVDNGKALFNFRLKMSSMFYPQSAKLAAFFKRCSNPNKSEVAQQAKSIVSELIGLDNVVVSRFFPMVMDELVTLLCSDQLSKDAEQPIFSAMTSVLSSLHGESPRRNPIAQDYLKRILHANSSWKSQYFEQVIHSWKLCIDANDSCLRDASRYSWFYLEIIFKGIIEKLHKSQKLGALPNQRGDLFNAKFYESFGQLLECLSKDVYALAKSGFNIGKDLNSELAGFFCKALGCLKTDFLYKHILRHTQGFNSDISVNVHLRYDFLKSISAFENAVAYSMPKKLQYSFVKSSFFLDQCLKHFFPAILQKSVFADLKSPSEEIRLKALTTLNEVLAKHEMDARFEDEESKKRVFNMFLPTLAASCDYFYMLKCKLENEKKSEEIGATERKLLSFSVAYLIRYMDLDLLIRWMDKESPTRANTFMDLLSFVCDSLQYIGKDKILENLQKGLKNGIKTNDNAKKYLENIHKTAGTLNGSNLRELRGTLRQFSAPNSNVPVNGKATLTTKTGTARSSQLQDATSIENATETIQEMQLIGLQSHEIYMICLTVVNKLFDTLHQNVDSKSSPISTQLERILDVLKTLLTLPQNQVSMSIALKLLGKSIVDYYRFILKSNKLCSDMCQLLLQAASLRNEKTRALASENIYLLMKYNYMEFKANIGKVRIQLTVALSNSEIEQPGNLKLGLLALKAFAMKDVNTLKLLPKMVEDAVTALTDILRDKVKMSLNKDDPEMLADMLYSLAQGYINTPDLRIAVLDSMAKLYISHNYVIEAGHCYLHQAALISEYLRFKAIDIGAPTGSKYFKSCSINIDEKAFSTEVNPEEEGICQSPSFSESGYFITMEKALEVLRKAQLHETFIEAQKLLIPSAEKERNIEQLVNYYSRIKEAYESIIATTGKRILGTFFRVSFFGSKFGSLDKKQFIYKERSVTQLSEIVLRLTDIYKKRFGTAFELVNDGSKIADPSKLDQNKAYLYVVKVEPFFTEKELKDRITYFERFNDASKFVFETPYTIGGKAQGEVDTQYKKKTILTVEKSFPYIKKRLLVTSVKEIDFTPIEVSLEALRERCDKFKTAIQTNPINLKNVQLLLQGSVRPQVNRGPFEIAYTFLGENSSKYKLEFTKALQSTFVEFLSLCHQALKISKELSPSDQDEYNADLEFGYNDFKSKMDALFGGNETPSSANSSNRESVVSTALNFLKENNNNKPMQGIDENAQNLFSFLNGK